MPALSTDHLILALDVDDPQEALGWVRRMKPYIGTFKVGLQLFPRGGMELLRRIADEGVGLFLDLKFHDIPNTVAHAVKSVSTVPIRFITVHTSGGLEMMKAARDAAPDGTTVLGVSVLTSMDERALQQVGVNRPVEDQVMQLVELGNEAGLRGYVCSPLEVEGLRNCFGPSLVLVTPGVRPAGAGSDDQSRIATPYRAIESGSNHVVIGRPILRSENPEEAVQALLISKE